MESEVVILTLSEKWGKKCVVAYDIENNRLVRLVSEPEHGGGIPASLTNSINLLDIVRVTIIKDCPIEHQTENVLIDLTTGFKKTGSLQNIELLKSLINERTTIFGNNKYKLDEANNLKHSIEIVKFDKMRFDKNDKGKTKATFYHNGLLHTNFSVTDSRFFGDVEPISSGYAIISLPPSDDFTKNGGGYFKYISAIF